jgi:hypothetical protein
MSQYRPNLSHCLRPRLTSARDPGQQVAVVLVPFQLISLAEDSLGVLAPRFRGNELEH